MAKQASKTAIKIKIIPDLESYLHHVIDVITKNIFLFYIISYFLEASKMVLKFVFFHLLSFLLSEEVSKRFLRHWYKNVSLIRILSVLRIDWIRAQKMIWKFYFKSLQLCLPQQMTLLGSAPMLINSCIKCFLKIASNHTRKKPFEILMDLIFQFFLWVIISHLKLWSKLEVSNFKLI